MRKIVVVLSLLVSLVALYAYAGPKAPIVPSHSQLLGFTEARVTGDSFDLAAACADAFPGSHVCTVRDIVRTSSVPQSVADLDPESEADWAWMDGSSLQIEGHSLMCGLPGPVRAPGGNGFDNILRGAAVSATGAVHALGCGASNRVACCGRSLVPRGR